MITTSHEIFFLQNPAGQNVSGVQDEEHVVVGPLAVFLITFLSKRFETWNVLSIMRDFRKPIS